MTLLYGADELAVAADAVAAEALAQAAMYEPPIEALELARRLGLTIAFDQGLEQRGRYVRLCQHGTEQPGQADVKGTILLRPDDRPERCQFAAAHEIGEHLAFRCLAYWSGELPDAPPGWRERAASLIAVRLLLPGEWFFSLASQCDWHLPDIKREFATASHELIAWRMLDHPTPQLVTIFDQGRLVMRRHNGECGPPRPCAAERAARALLRGDTPSADCVDHRAEGMRVQAWAIDEPHWQRDILRTSITNDEVNDFL